MRPIRFRSFVPFFAPGIRRCPVRPVLHAVPTRAEIHLTPIRGNPGVHAHQGLHAVDAACPAVSRSAGRPARGATAPGKAVRHAGRVRKPFVRLRRRPVSVRVRSSAPESVRVIAFDALVAAATATRRAPRPAPMHRASGPHTRRPGLQRGACASVNPSGCVRPGNRSAAARAAAARAATETPRAPRRPSAPSRAARRPACRRAGRPRRPCTAAARCRRRESPHRATRACRP